MKTEMQSTSMVLLGAGASVDAGIPTAVDMTQRMFEIFHQSYRIEEQELQALRLVISGLQFRHGLRRDDPFQKVNIEELFTAVEMLAKRKELEIAPFVNHWNPAIEALDQYVPQKSRTYELRKHLKDFGEIILQAANNEQYSLSSQPVHDFVDELEKVLLSPFSREEGAIFQKLSSRMLKELGHLVWINDPAKITYLLPLVRQGAQQVFTVATLNYDNGVELACRMAKIPVDTGLSSWTNYGEFRKPSGGIELLKLHGSIEWGKKKEQASNNSLPQVTIYSIQDLFEKLSSKPTPGLLEDTFENMLDSDSRAIVFGARNKLTAEGPFLELLRTFQMRLEEHETLLTIGYSFRDPHINEAVTRWFNRRETRKIIAIDQEGATFAENAFVVQYQDDFITYPRFLAHRFEVRGVGACRGIADFFS